MWIDAEKLSGAFCVENIICLAFLLGISVYDIYFHRISRFVLVLSSLFAAGYALAGGRAHWLLSAAGAAAGFLLIAAAYFTKEAIGYGDGWLITSLGIYMGIWGLMEVMAAAWVLLACAAGICLVKKKWSRKAALPMTPFITAGFLIFLLGEYLYAQ